MIALVQRVSSAQVVVKSDPNRKNVIGSGLVILLGVGRDDGESDVGKLAAKISKLRIFADLPGKMNLDIKTAGGAILLISQFTLIAKVKGQNRPSFIKAAGPELARSLYEKLAQSLTASGVPVKTGFFGEYMEITASLDGPVTLYLNSHQL